MSEDKFHNLLSGTASEEEKKAFYSQLEKDGEKQETFLQFKNIHMLSSFRKSDYSRLAEESFTRFWKTVHPQKQSKLLHPWVKYAAIFLLALASGYVLRSLIQTGKPVNTYKHQIKYQSEKGSISSVELDDGSKIWLSSRTILTIDEHKTGKLIVHLDGQAYFDLIHDPKRDLTVDLGSIKIKDIGTTFDIRAYSDEQTISTMLVSGGIDIRDKSENQLLTMRPGDYVQYNKNSNLIKTSEADPSMITAWKEGRFVFIDMSLLKICQELGNWYNVEFIIEDQSLAATHYTSIIKRSTSVIQVLKVLSYTDNIHYNIINRKEGKDLIIIKK